VLEKRLLAADLGECLHLLHNLPESIQGDDIIRAAQLVPLSRDDLEEMLFD
jgi:hypothetical protein